MGSHPVPVVLEVGRPASTIFVIINSIKKRADRRKKVDVLTLLVTKMISVCQEKRRKEIYFPCYDHSLLASNLL